MLIGLISMGEPYGDILDVYIADRYVSSLVWQDSLKTLQRHASGIATTQELRQYLLDNIHTINYDMKEKDAQTWWDTIKAHTQRIFMFDSKGKAHSKRATPTVMTLIEYIDTNEIEKAIVIAKRYNSVLLQQWQRKAEARLEVIEAYKVLIQYNKTLSKHRGTVSPQEIKNTVPLDATMKIKGGKNLETTVSPKAVQTPVLPEKKGKTEAQTVPPSLDKTDVKTQSHNGE